MLDTHLIPVVGPLRFDLALKYLATSPSTIAEVVDNRAYRRAFRGPDGPAVLTACLDPGGISVAVEGPGSGRAALTAATEIVRRVFGLDADLAGMEALSTTDPIIGGYVERYRGLRIVTVPDPFEALVWAILGQQINIAFAAKMKRTLIAHYGDEVEVGATTYRLFPLPGRLTEVTPELLRPLQISRQKAIYIGELARAVVDGAIDLDGLRSLPDDEVVSRLIRIKGIGRWTAEYLLLRGFGRLDAIPAGDMGQRAIVGRLYALGRNATEDEVRRLAERWAPWRGCAAFYLWFALQQRDW